jgi:hypothetical protein
MSGDESESLPAMRTRQIGESCPADPSVSFAVAAGGPAVAVDSGISGRATRRGPRVLLAQAVSPVAGRGPSSVRSRPATSRR